MSKRKLLELVRDKHVAGWDDPRMPTICGLRRRGYTPEAMRQFCERIGVAKFNSTIDMAVLENAMREDLNARAPRRMAVLRPLKVVHRELSGGQSRKSSKRSTIRKTRRPAREKFRSPRAVHRAGRFPRRAAEEVLPPRARPRSAAALRVLHQVRQAW